LAPAKSRCAPQRAEGQVNALLQITKSVGLVMATGVYQQHRVSSSVLRRRCIGMTACQRDVSATQQKSEGLHCKTEVQHNISQITSQPYQGEKMKKLLATLTLVALCIAPIPSPRAQSQKDHIDQAKGKIMKTYRAEQEALSPSSPEAN
jgi:hypothetical protein